MTATIPDYITVKETAEAWSVTKRYVNMCIEDGRIPGAVRMGNMWLVPKGADKPAGLRREKKAPENSPLSDLADMIRATYISAPRDNPDLVIELAGEERLRLIHEGALAYARGDFERAKRCFQQNSGDVAAKLCSCEIAVAAAISTGDYPFYTEIETWLIDVARANISGEATALAELALAAAYLGAMAPNMVPDWLRNGDFSALPPEVRPEALYMRVKYFQCVGNYAAMLAVAQTALVFCGSEKGISFPEMYLKLMCAVSLYALERTEEARIYLLDVMQSNLPHGFITPFAELMPLFGGLLELLLEREYPTHLAAVTAQWNRTFNNWIAFHNRFAKANITLILTLREYEIALLAARGMSRAKIAERLHISIGTVKNHILKIYGKLFISSRKELAKYIL